MPLMSEVLGTLGPWDQHLQPCSVTALDPAGDELVQEGLEMMWGPWQ